MSAGTKPWGRETLALLRPGPFRRYIIGTSISDTGTWMQIMAQGWVMSTLTDKAIMLGMVNFAAGLPMIFLTMFGGSMADRFDKRRILVWTQVVQIALAIVVGILIFSGRIQIWHIIAVAGLLGIAFAFEHPALSALVPELVTHEEIAGAVALDRAVFHCARLVGPSVGGLIVGLWGAATAFFTNAVSFFAFIVALVSLPPRPIGSQEEEQQRASGIKDGFRYVRADKPSLAMVGMIASMTIFIFPTVSVMMPLYVRDVLHFGPDRLGYLMAASGIGSVFGAITLVSIARSRRLGWMMASALAVMFAVLALSRVNAFGLRGRVPCRHLVWLIPYLWSLEHDRAGAGAVTSPRPRLGRHGSEFLWLDADRRPRCHQPGGRDRYAHCACHLGDRLRCGGAFHSQPDRRALERNARGDHRFPNAGSSGRIVGVVRQKRMLSFSTCWNSSRHTAGDEMLREIKNKLGFDLIELGHGIRISLMPGVQKMFDAGEVQLQQPAQFLSAAGGSDGRVARLLYLLEHLCRHERQRAVKQTFQTIDFAARLGAPFVVLHLGHVPIKPVTEPLIALAKTGEMYSREYVRRKVDAVAKREATALCLPGKREGMPQTDNRACCGE